MNNATTIKVWNWNNNGKLISAIDVADFDEARKLALEWNRRHRNDDDNSVSIIGNNSVQAHCTKICAV